MHQVIATDRKAIAVTSDNPHLQVGTTRFQPRGHRWRPTVDRVDAVSVHVIGKATRTADAGNEHDVFARHAQRRQHFFHLGQDRVVAAAGAPTYVLVAGEVCRFQYREWGFDAHGRRRVSVVSRPW